MSYSRWNKSYWYTYWTTDSPDGWFPTKKLIRNQLLCINCKFWVSVGEIQDNIYDLVNNVIPMNFPHATNEQIKELEGYMWEFVIDMYSNEFTYKNFFLHKYYYPIRNKIKNLWKKKN